MFSGGHDPSVSLLPDNPNAQITPVQGGGANPHLSGEWKCLPVLIEEATKKLPVNHGSVKKYKNRWRQTLGPNIPSRRKPRQDPHIVVGILNVLTCPVYIVAPLRGEEKIASNVFSWAHELLESDPEQHIVFMAPIVHKENKQIESGLVSLLAMYPGHVIYVSEKDSELPSVNGLLIHGVPKTSKQISLGFIPEHENVYERSSRNLDCLSVETLRVPYSKVKEADSSESIFNLSFDNPMGTGGRERDMNDISIHGNKKFKSVPGWVSRLEFGNRLMRGGDNGDVVPPAHAATETATETASETATATAAKDANEDANEDSNEDANEAPAAPAAPATAAAPAAPATAPAAPAPAANTMMDDSTPSTIRNPVSAMSEWVKGEFTDSERIILQEEGLMYPNDVYSKLLEAIASKKCETEPDIHMNPECGVWRFILADKFYRKLKDKNRKCAGSPEESSGSGADGTDADGSGSGAAGTGTPGSAGTGTDGTGAAGTPGTGTPGTGTPGTGTPGSGADGTGTPGTGTPGTGTPGTGTPGTPGSGTPGSGTPGSGTPGTGTPGSGTPGPAGSGSNSETAAGILGTAIVSSQGPSTEPATAAEPSSTPAAAEPSSTPAASSTPATAAEASSTPAASSTLAASSTPAASSTAPGNATSNSETAAGILGTAILSSQGSPTEPATTPQPAASAIPAASAVAAPEPVALPVATPMAAPVPVPVALPVAVPVASPEPVAVASPEPVAVAAPVAAPVPVPVVNHSANAKTAVEIIGAAIRDLLTPAPVPQAVASSVASSVASPVAAPEPINQTPGNILSTAIASSGQRGGTRSRRKRKWDSKKRKN